METVYEKIVKAWSLPNRSPELSRVVESLAHLGISREALDEALGKLLDEVRAQGVGEEAEEVILSMGDRLHDWCHVSRRVDTQASQTGLRQTASPDSEGSLSIQGRDG